MKKIILTFSIMLMFLLGLTGFLDSNLAKANAQVSSQEKLLNDTTVDKKKNMQF